MNGFCITSGDDIYSIKKTQETCSWFSCIIYQKLKITECEFIFQGWKVAHLLIQIVTI